MRYELLLQPSEPNQPWEPDRLERLLAARGVDTVGAGGTRIWKLKSGPIELKPLRDGQTVRGLELHVSLSDRTELVSELVQEASTLAQDTGLRLYDPQLSRSVSVADEAAVADQFLRTARYAGEMLGVPEALDASFAATEPGSNTGLKVIAGLVGAGILLLWVLDWFAGQLGGG